jgi:hypothetical protein
VAVLRGYQAEIIGEVDPLVAGRSALDLNIRQNREDAGEAVAGQIERAQAPKDVGADLHATRCPAATADTTIGEGAGGLIASVLKAKESERSQKAGADPLDWRIDTDSGGIWVLRALAATNYTHTDAAAEADAGRRKAAADEARSAPETDQFGRINRENSLASVQGQRGGHRSRAKGDRIEHEIVSRHTEIGVKAERYPLSGASRFRGSAHDIDVYERDGAVVLSIALQHGADLERIRRALCRDSQGRASGPLGAALDIIMGSTAP